MIRYFYRTKQSRETKEFFEFRSGCWVYVENPTDEELSSLAKQFGLNHAVLRDALDYDEMPRLERDDDYSYIFVRFAYQPKKDTSATAPLLFIFNPDVFITISLVTLPSVDRFVNSQIDFSTEQKHKLLLLILQQISTHYNRLISATAKRVKSIHGRLQSHNISNRDFVAFVTMLDELNGFLSSLQPTNSTLRRLAQDDYVKIFGADQAMIGDLLLNNEQSIESCNSVIKSIGNIREAYSAISANNLNRTLFVLTAATVIMAIPTLFYSMYGMNMPLPAEKDPWMFWAVIGFTLFLAIAVVGALAVARKKRLF